MLLPSTGFTCGTFCSNDAMFTRGTMMTVPEISAGLSSCISFSSAMMDAYSVPCRAGHQGESRPGHRAANYRNRDIRARVAPRRDFDESGNGLPGDCFRGSHSKRWLLCRGRHAQNATPKNQCQPLAHTRLLQSTPESRQSITPPVESYTEPRAFRRTSSPFQDSGSLTFGQWPFSFSNFEAASKRVYSSIYGV